MGDWYTIGLAAGLGVAIGILAAGLFPRRWVAPVLAALVGLGIGLLVENWQEALAGFIGGFLGGSARRRSCAERCAAAARAAGSRRSSAAERWSWPRSRSSRSSGTSSRSCCRCSGCGRVARARPPRGPAHAGRDEPPKPVVLIVIDGLTPSMLEAADTPALRFLLEHGTYRRAVSTFPSLTPVCLASIATGGHGDVHGIPHLVWWNRGEQRLVEYGSSFGALLASGVAQGIRDSVVNLNERHLLRSAETVFEALEGAGLTTAAINITTYRGRHRHLSLVPGFPPVHGPKRFFFYSLYESDRTGAKTACAATAPPARWTPTPPRSAAGSSRAAASTCSSSTSRLRLRLARARA